MKHMDFSALLRRFGPPALTAAVGLILLLNPDSAAALVGKLLAWVLVLTGLGLGAGALRHCRNSQILWAVMALAAGIWMLGNPLVLAKGVGRVLGLVLLLQGIRDVRLNIKLNGGRPAVTAGMLLACAVALVGLVLLVLPMATSRLLFSVLGIVLICVGAAEIFDRLRSREQLEAGDDPDIIDAEKL